MRYRLDDTAQKGPRSNSGMAFVRVREKRCAGGKEKEGVREKRELTDLSKMPVDLAEKPLPTTIVRCDIFSLCSCQQLQILYTKEQMVGCPLYLHAASKTSAPGRMYEGSTVASHTRHKVSIHPRLSEKNTLGNPKPQMRASTPDKIKENAEGICSESSVDGLPEVRVRVVAARQHAAFELCFCRRHVWH